MIKSILREDHLKMLMNIFTAYYHYFAICLGGFGYMLYRARRSPGEFLKEHDLAFFSLAVWLTLFAAHFVAGLGGYKIYSLYFIYITVLCASAVLYALYSELSRNGAWESVRGMAAGLLAGLILFSAISLGIFGYDIIFFTRFDFSDTDLARTKRGGEYLASLTDPDDIILTIDNPHIVYTAGRYEIPSLINVNFTYRDSADRNELTRLNMYNSEMFMEWMRETATVVVFQRDGLAERLAPMGIEGARRAEFDRLLAEVYQHAGSIENVYFRKGQRGEGIMEIYKRRE
jgi:hypothetical protein